MSIMIGCANDTALFDEERTGSDSALENGMTMM
jgi:hypothetical protein